MHARTRLAAVCLVVVSTGVAACDSPGTTGPPVESASGSSLREDAEVSDVPESSPAPSDESALPSRTARPDPRPVTIAFAGDVHFEGALASRLDGGVPVLGGLGRRLVRADLAIVNLETAVTTRGTPEPKEYVFRAAPRVFSALKRYGVDVVTMANNHGLDYGPPSVPDALAAAREAELPVIGLGQNADRAYRPWIVEVKGQRIAFLAATAVVDASLVESWSARSDQAGVATALNGDNAALVDAVEAVRPKVDTVVVDMHYGSDLRRCPTEIQKGVVRDVVRAGADIVVGQHAHVLLGGGYRGSAYVHYGLGNFQFYSYGGPTAETGVLRLRVLGREVLGSQWFPGVLSGGLPTALTGAAADEATARWERLRSCAGLTGAPGP